MKNQRSLKKYLIITAALIMIKSPLIAQVIPVFKDEWTGTHLKFPCEVVCDISNLQVQSIDIVYKECKCEEKISNRLKIKYSYQVASYPFDLQNEADLVSELFAVSHEEAVRSVFGKLDYESFVEINGYPASIWRISYDKGQGIIKTKSLIKGNFFINVKVDYPQSHHIHRAIDQFLQSVYVE